MGPLVYRALYIGPLYIEPLYIGRLCIGPPSGVHDKVDAQVASPLARLEFMLQHLLMLKEALLRGPLLIGPY